MELDDLIGQSFSPDRDAEVFITFLRHFKSNSTTTLKDLRNKASSGRDKMRTGLFLDLFEAVFAEFQQRLAARHEIDFEDLINQSCEHLESGRYVHHYKHILVDEFQDITQDQKRLVQALLRQDPDCRLFAVGDDWQSIYRFAGSDIDIITRFESRFARAKFIRLSSFLFRR